jgi:hypothetical protein
VPVFAVNPFSRPCRLEARHPRFAFDPPASQANAFGRRAIGGLLFSQASTPEPALTSSVPPRTFHGTLLPLALERRERKGATCKQIARDLGVNRGTLLYCCAEYLRDVDKLEAAPVAGAEMSWDPSVPSTSVLWVSCTLMRVPSTPAPSLAFRSPFTRDRSALRAGTRRDCARIRYSPTGEREGGLVGACSHTAAEGERRFYFPVDRG